MACVCIYIFLCFWCAQFENVPSDNRIHFFHSLWLYSISRWTIFFSYARRYSIRRDFKSIKIEEFSISVGLCVYPILWLCWKQCFVKFNVNWPKHKVSEHIVDDLFALKFSGFCYCYRDEMLNLKLKMIILARFQPFSLHF